MPTLRLVYDGFCPNCGGAVCEDRLAAGLPCETCLPLTPDAIQFLSRLPLEERLAAVARLLSEAGSLRDWRWASELEEEAVTFERFFERLVGSRPWSAQRQWVRRLLRGESFAITAPTGTGKTTLLSVYTLYTASKGARIYYLLPTSSLAQQVAARLVEMAERGGVRARIAYYHSMMGARARREALGVIESGEYDVLVTTTAFLSRRFSLLEGTRFDVIVVDDVDAVLRDSVNVDRILVLLGADREEVRAALRLVRLEMRIRANPALAKRLGEEVERLRSIVKAASGKLGQLVVASATGRARGFRRLALSKLLGLSVGNLTGYARNIAEFKLVASDPAAMVADIVARLGPGGIVFVAKPLGVQAARSMVRLLEERGVRAGLAVSGRRVVERFARGELDVLVGVASYYGVIVRGLDLPFRIAYAVFLEPPYTRVALERALKSPRRIMRLAKALGVEGAGEYAKLLSRMSPDEVDLLRAALEGRIEPGPRIREAYELAVRIAGLIEEAARRAGVVDAGSSILVGGDEPFVAAPDVYTYLQASGRTSRLVRGFMTRGVAIVVSSWDMLLSKLEGRLARIIPGFSFQSFEWSLVGEELEKAWRTRRIIGAPPSKRIVIETGLVVVESPTKARLIASFWGKPARKNYGDLVVYETAVYNPSTGVTHLLMVTATRGHITDLTEDEIGVHGVVLEGDEVKPVYSPIVKCLDCGEQHATSSNTCPRCGSERLESKKRVVEALRRLAPLVDVVYVATDPDYEGEKIGWDAAMLVKPFARSIRRIEFHEVTKRAFLEALAKPRDLDRRLVEAQVVRRVEDRIIGFELSQHLWQVYRMRWLGAGRVQTPALGFLVERLEEWRRSRCYAVSLRLPWGRFVACFWSREEALEAARAAEEEGVELVVLEERDEVVPPPPPYTTETLLYDASRLLGYTSEKTMRLAQDLFENGLITYHRTDSTRVSDVGLWVAREYLARMGLESLYTPRRWGEGGAHEAIRPTNPLDVNQLREAIAEGEVRVAGKLRESHYRLYDLIFRRFVASQSRPARVRVAKVELRAGNVKLGEETLAVRVYDAGFARFYPYALRVWTGGLRVRPETVRVYRGSRVRLYTHGDLVMVMKRVGIGRPSTYARIIEALKRHGYVIESRYRKYLVPTSLGRRVYRYLSTVFAPLVSVERTRSLEERMDAVARGEADAAQLILEVIEEVRSAVEEAEARIGEAVGEALGA